MVLGCDLDGVLCQFNQSYARLLAQTNGQDLLPADWEYNAEVFKCWDWDQAYGYSSDVIGQVWTKGILQNDTFWHDLHVMPGSYGSIKHLNQLTRDGHLVYFITNRQGQQAKVQTEKWLYSRGMDRPTVLLSGNKIPLIHGLGINWFIDDRQETILEVAEYVEKFREGGAFRLYCMDAPYNKSAYPEMVRVVKSVGKALEDSGL